MNGVSFNGLHAFDYYGFLLTSYEVEPPSPQTYFVSIPGGDGSLDLTEHLGRVCYNRRKIKISLATLDTENTDLINNIHGREIKTTFDDDPSFYYLGRANVKRWVVNKNVLNVEIEIDAEPYKKDISQMEMSFSVSGTLTKVLTNKRQPVSPTLTVSANMTVAFGSATYDLLTGTQVVKDIVLTEGANRLTFNGTGTVLIRYRMGEL